jgi:hypothetical protein
MRTPLWERLARDWIAGSASGTILDLRALAGPIFYTWSEEDLMESGILGAATHAVERLEGVRIPAGDEVRALRIVRGLRQNEEGAWPPPGYVVEVLEEQARLWDEEEEETVNSEQRTVGSGQEGGGADPWLEMSNEGIREQRERMSKRAQWMADLESAIGRGALNEQWSSWPALEEFEPRVGPMIRLDEIDGPAIEVSVGLELHWRGDF